jgi:lipopolysaccharide transport system permease protein
MSQISHVTAQSAATLELTPEPSLAAWQQMAWRDLREALTMWRLCWTLAWLDIRLRYRGSMLGPFWLTLSTALMVGAMGGIYSELLHISMRDYLPFLALSLVLWTYISTLVTDACLAFTQAEATIRSVRIPFMLYAARIVVRGVLILAHNLLAIVLVFGVMEVAPGWTAFLALPAFLLWLLDSLAVALLLGALCARFRDIPPIVASVMQMVFFVTPVIWKPELVGPGRAWVLTFNPIYSALEIVRGPLMGTVPSAHVYVSALIFSLLMCGVAWLLFARVRGRIAFWV